VISFEGRVLKLITWNVQWCRGVDGRVDPARIARTALALADFDVLCLQEIAIHFDGLAGSSGEDQMAALSTALPGYTGLFGAATDLSDDAGHRRQFGNAIFTRLPVLQAFRHLLPWPADSTVPSMQRLALEAVLQSQAGSLRVISTHLEYYSAQQRMAQVEGLRHLHREASMHAAHPHPRGDPGSPFDALPRPAAALLCGDFNFPPGSPEHETMRAPFDDGTTAALRDAWTLAHPGEPHALTAGLYDKAWSQPCCFDFVFVSDDLASRVVRVEVEGSTQASDHQPVVVELR
jgi:endonuclease/exonuclease/phosphatase family metal-dependent hydrolase